MELAEISHVL